MADLTCAITKRMEKEDVVTKEPTVETRIPSIDEADISQLHKAFKNPKYKRPKTRNLKQILAAEASARQTNPIDPNLPTFSNIEATPSLMPQKHYCDVTGLIARYTDPKSKMRYHNKEVYEFIRTLPPGIDQAYLQLRKSQIVLK